jgi:hypothetical protein
MAEYKDREHYIPLRVSELVQLLGSDRGVEGAAGRQFRAFSELLSATFHFEYHRLLEQLKDVYAPFDPDAVTHSVQVLTDAQRAQKLDELYKHFVYLMERANFKRLTTEEIQAAVRGTSDWGLPMDVDLRVFERLEVYVRGDTLGERTLRRWWRPWRVEQVRLPLYQRLVLFVKLRPNRRLPREIDTDAVFLKTFKDIPKLDLEMLFPGARLKMPGLQRLKLGGSLLGGGAMLGYGVAGQLIEAVLNPQLLLAPLAALFGYGYKQYYGYQSTRNVFHLRLTQSLYYQTLGNNLGVLFHLLDEAEEQECREALLAYYYLWRHAGAEGWRAADLDDYVEMDLERLANLKVDFEIDDALAKLERLKLVAKLGERFTAVPIEKALETLDFAWDNYFRYNKTGRDV